MCIRFQEATCSSPRAHDNSRNMTEAYMTEASSSRSTSTGNTGKDPRLDTTAWRVFGRRLPRRWSVYARIVGAVLLILFLTWWFTQDVTYENNVKVSGLGSSPAEYQDSLREIARDFAALVNIQCCEVPGYLSQGVLILSGRGAQSGDFDVVLISHILGKPPGKKEDEEDSTHNACVHAPTAWEPASEYSPGCGVEARIFSRIPCRRGPGRGSFRHVSFRHVARVIVSPGA